MNGARQRFRFLLIAMTLGGLLGSGTAAWAECPDAVDRVLVFPHDGASDVPRNVVLRAEFPPTRDPRGEPHWRVLDDRGQSVPGEVSWDGRTSTFTPDELFEQRRTYTARVTAQATGEYWDIHFLVGEGTDSSAPSFRGVGSVSWEEAPESQLIAECSLARGDGFIFTLSVPTPSDDRGADSLCYYVYETSGPQADERPVATLDEDGDGVIRLFFPVEDGEGEFCFHVEVRDLAGRFDGNQREVCTEAVAGAVYGNLCSVTAVGGRGDAGDGVPVAIALLGVALFWRRRRRRS